MLQSSDILSILERLTQLNTPVTKEEVLVLSELIKYYDSKGIIKQSIILKIFLAYKILLGQDDDLAKGINSNKLLKNAINTIRFNELELYIPSKQIEWILLRIGQIFLNKEYFKQSKELFAISRDLFKLINNDQGTTISNYFLAYFYYLEGKDLDKSARLLEIVGPEFQEIELKFNCQFNAALLYYPANLKRCLNLLENCLLLFENNNTQKLELNINKNLLEDFLNKIRREYILKHYNDAGDLFQIIENLTTSLHKKGDILNLAASYYEAGTVFDNLNYGDTAEDYYIEAARLSAEKEEWKLYSKSLIQLIIKFIEKGELENSKIYLNDLNIIAIQLKDDELLKKTKTLLSSLEKLHVDSNIINVSTNEIENLIGPEIDNQTTYSFPKESNSSLEKTSSVDEQELFNSVLESGTIGESNEVISFQTDTEKVEKTKEKEDRTGKKDSKPSFYNTRERIVIKLNDRGFDTHLDMKPVKGGITVDIVAIKGKIRKKKLYIMLAETRAEGELSAKLLNSLKDSAEKIIFVFGETARKQKKGGITFCFKMNQLIFS